MGENGGNRGIIMKNLEKGRQRNTPTYGAMKDETNEGMNENPINHQRQVLLKGAKTRLIFALLLCILVVIAEIVGSILSGSLAILADAGHLLTDIVTYIISLTSIWLAQKPPSKRFTFGLLRAEVVGALFSIIISVCLAVVLSYFAIMRIVHQEFEIDGEVMLIIGIINFFGNIIQIIQLQFGFCCCTSQCGSSEEGLLSVGHGHSHGSLFGGSGDGVAEDEIKRHMNVRAACLHIFGDCLFGFGLLIGALIIYYQPGFKILDPILTIVFGAIVLITLSGLLRDSVYILMAGKPRSVDYDDAKRRLVEIDGVEDVHSLRIWSLTSDVHLVCVHLVLARFYDGRPVDGPKVLREARHILETHFGVVHSTIQIETVEDGVEFLCARTTTGPA
ncbi:zinc transporter 2-like isoform X2 [Lytechinus variegatus]|uniref:zinc transporter 2-like isoform X2 n=1 Tax=Lytechinus variegatus TaxID=7654 RepID=UPI001BB22730|nr:zinc transporter 2-like isoform X2 [Lytechinus variegatus]